jgi:hypothetical protein
LEVTQHYPKIEKNNDYVLAKLQFSPKIATSDNQFQSNRCRMVQHIEFHVLIAVSLILRRVF